MLATTWGANKQLCLFHPTAPTAPTALSHQSVSAAQMRKVVGMFLIASSKTGTQLHCLNSLTVINLLIN